MELYENTDVVLRRGRQATLDGSDVCMRWNISFHLSPYSTS